MVGSPFKCTSYSDRMLQRFADFRSVSDSLSTHCILRIDGQVNGFGLLDLRHSVLHHNSESF